MEFNKKEKYIKQVIENQEFKLDTMDLWNAIEDRVEKTEETNRKGFLAIFFPFLLGAFLVAGLWMYFSIDEKGQNKVTLQSASAEQHELPAQGEKGNNEQKNSAETEKSQELLEENSALAISTKNVSRPHAQLELNTKTTEPRSSVKTNAENERLGENALPIQDAYAVNPHGGTLTQTSNASRALADQEESRSQSENRDQEFNKLRALTVIEDLKSIMRLTTFLEAPIDQREMTIEDFVRPGTSFPGRWSLFAGAGPNLVQSDFETAGAPRIENELLKEENLVGYNFGIGLEYKTKRQWQMRTLLDHSTIVSRYQNNEEVVFQAFEEGVTQIFEDPVNGISETSGQVLTESEVDYDLKWHRMHSKFGVAFSFGKAFTIGKRFTFDLNAGIRANLWNTHKGYYFEEANVPFKKFETESNYTQEVSAQPIVGLVIHLKLNPYWSIGIISDANLTRYQLLNSQSNYQIKNSQLNTLFVVKRELNWEK